MDYFIKKVSELSIRVDYFTTDKSCQKVSRDEIGL